MNFECVIRNDSHSPKYQQLKDCILVAIEDGTLKSGDKLPSESELQDLLEISRTTVRRALQELNDAGYIRIDAGRGSFVLKKALLDPVKGLTAQLTQQDRMASTEVLMKTVIHSPSEPLARKLEIQLDYSVAFIRRLRFADNEPIALQDVYIPLYRCPNILAYDLTGSLYTIFEQLGLQPATADNEFGAVFAPEEVRVSLNLSNEPTAVIVMRQVTRTQDALPIEFVKSIYRPEETFHASHVHHDIQTVEEILAN